MSSMQPTTTTWTETSDGKILIKTVTDSTIRKPVDFLFLFMYNNMGVFIIKKYGGRYE